MFAAHHARLRKNDNLRVVHVDRVPPTDDTVDGPHETHALKPTVTANLGLDFIPEAGARTHTHTCTHTHAHMHAHMHTCTHIRWWS